MSALNNLKASRARKVVAGLLAAIFLLGAVASPAFADRGRGGDDRHRGNDGKRFDRRVKVKKVVKIKKVVKVKKVVKKFNHKKFDHRKFDHRR